MPVTGSITDGIIAGLFTYVVFSFIDGWMNRYKKNKKQETDK
jgi:AGZA family xanthine/uracil permease-like MFS transporter